MNKITTESLITTAIGAELIKQGFAEYDAGYRSYLLYKDVLLAVCAELLTAHGLSCWEVKDTIIPSGGTRKKPIRRFVVGLIPTPVGLGETTGEQRSEIFDTLRELDESIGHCIRKYGVLPNSKDYLDDKFLPVSEVFMEKIIQELSRLTTSIDFRSISTIKPHHQTH